jgi:hypothetical protein
MVSAEPTTLSPPLSSVPRHIRQMLSRHNSDRVWWFLITPLADPVEAEEQCEDEADSDDEDPEGHGANEWRHYSVLPFLGYVIQSLSLTLAHVWLTAF